MRIAIQGERGSFSHEAALQMAPELTEVQSCAYSAEVFERLIDARAEAAVIPIENSLAGSVLEHYDLLLANPVRIQAELLLRIRHHLIAAPGVPLSAIREVYSHPVALAQCRNFFASHPGLRALPYYDTAGSAAHAVRSGEPIAGVAGDRAAREYGGEVLASGIEDNPRNYTRFLLLDRSAPTAGVEPALSRDSSADKVSVAFALPHRPGSLVAALSIFARHDLNLTRLESRPVPGSPWEYVFYADYQLRSTQDAELALAELAESCSFVKELGRYPAALAPTVTVP